MRLLLPHFLIAFLMVSSTASSRDLLKGNAFELYSQEQPLRDVLTAIATHARMGVQINEEIDTDFSGQLKQRNSMEALNYLANSFDLVWYSDGSTLFVDPINAMASRLFPLDRIAARKVETTMRNLAIFDARFEWRSLADQSILMVSGPPRYLELVEETIDLLNAQFDAEKRDGLRVSVFKLTHASATDRRVDVRDEQILLPGVASLLRGLVQGSTDSVESDGELGDSARFSRTVSDAEEGAKEKLKEKTRDTHRNQVFNGGPHPQAAIFSDPSTNSVIVQDFSERLSVYEELVAQLDVPRQQLEISLLIIDLTANSLFDLGVDWTVASRFQGQGILDLVLPGASEAARETLGQTNADFLATVTALESQGKAKVTSRPAVVTENGMEALLDNNESFFVRVQGERVATLEQITFGTLLQVVPRIIDSGDDNKTPFVNLDVQIEDASRLVDGGVDALPSIRNTQISTRSSVPNGGSLLIGGYYREATTTSQDGIPVLSNVPFLGSLFRRKGDSSAQLVRLFMLSPRILTEEAFASSPEYSAEQLSHSQQIRQLSDLSNYNPEIKRLRYQSSCESALSARQRRNSYRSARVPTKIIPCHGDGGKSTYRVITL